MDVTAVLKALGEPTRFRIFSCLLERKHCVRSLSKTLGITESAVSQHLKLMREAGMIYGEKYGYHTHYLPRQEVLDDLVELFTAMRRQSIALDRDKTLCQCEYRKVVRK